VHDLARGSGVLLVRERSDRDLDEAWVGDVQLPVCKCPRHRLHQEPCRLGARPPMRGEVEPFEEVQHLKQRQPAGRRSGRGHLEASIRAANRLGDVDAIALQVFPGDESAVGLEVQSDFFSNLTLVEGVWAPA